MQLHSGTSSADMLIFKVSSKAAEHFKAEHVCLGKLTVSVPATSNEANKKTDGNERTDGCRELIDTSSAVWNNPDIMLAFATAEGKRNNMTESWALEICRLIDQRHNTVSFQLPTVFESLFVSQFGVFFTELNLLFLVCAQHRPI